MTINEFIAKWCQFELKERSAAQEHFLDLCAILERLLAMNRERAEAEGRGAA